MKEIDWSEIFLSINLIKHNWTNTQSKCNLNLCNAHWNVYVIDFLTFKSNKYCFEELDSIKLRWFFVGSIKKGDSFNYEIKMVSRL